MPFSIKIWNMLNNSVKNSPTLEIFKKQIKPYREHNVLYYYGRRWLNIHHARLRLGCSKLNYDLCYNLRVKDSPTCSCGHRFETAEHFLISCPSYDLLRVGLQKLLHNTANLQLMLCFCMETAKLTLKEIKLFLMQYLNLNTWKNQEDLT